MLRHRKLKWLLLSILTTVLFLIVFPNSIEEEEQPETTWTMHTNITEVGWSQEKLQQAKNYYDTLPSTAAMIIYDGKILAAWGDISSKSNIHSVRKSFLSGLYGINEHSINLDATLEELRITDIGLLLDTEKEATVHDLLTARSGVFLKAGEESIGMRWKRPTRGIHTPGTYFYYNNWDFNVLGTIYKQTTNTDLFEEFYHKIAMPIGMEDFTLEDTHYKYELRRSLHPSYLFRMSARDMARFGQLYLQKGEWEGVQVISEEWITKSITAHTYTPISHYDYGYMWWVANDGYWKEVGLFSAIGRYGQSIDVVPSENLVFVHRVNSDRFLTRNLLYNHVNNRQRLHLLELILKAKQ